MANCTVNWRLNPWEPLGLLNTLYFFIFAAKFLLLVALFRSCFVYVQFPCSPSGNAKLSCHPKALQQSTGQTWPKPPPSDNHITVPMLSATALVLTDSNPKGFPAPPAPQRMVDLDPDIRSSQLENYKSL